MTATQTLTYGPEQIAGPRGQFRYCKVFADGTWIGHVEFSPSREFGDAYFATDRGTVTVPGQPAMGFDTAQAAARWLASR